MGNIFLLAMLIMSQLMSGAYLKKKKRSFTKNMKVSYIFLLISGVLLVMEENFILASTWCYRGGTGVKGTVSTNGFVSFFGYNTNALLNKTGCLFPTCTLQ
ncbi:hypothetical protein Avbf_07563 [Armadillidium vulgare]|nr:hypothetical protein Avbf_07563 [Armadillidium vulgare]